MKYKVLKGTDLFEKFMEWDRKRTKCNDVALDLVHKIAEPFGGSEKGEHLGEGHAFDAGGISGIALKEKPANWKAVYTKHYNNIYFPMQRKVNADLLKQINDLPKMPTKERNDIIGFQPHFGDHKYYRSYGISFKEECILIDMDNEVPFTPVEGMVEILESEYVKLYKSK